MVNCRAAGNDTFEPRVDEPSDVAVWIAFLERGSGWQAANGVPKSGKPANKITRHLV